MSTAKPVQLEDRACFHCTHRGNCCRGLEDQLMLEPADAYDMARYLWAQGRVNSILFQVLHSLYYKLRPG